MHENLKVWQCLVHLWKFIKPHQVKLWLGLGMTVILQMVLSLLPSLEGLVITQLQNDLSGIAKHLPGAQIQVDVIVRLLLILLISYMTKLSLQFGSAFTLTDSIQKTVYDLRNAVEHKINRLPVAYFDAHPTGDLLSRITNDVETVSDALQQTLQRTVQAACTIVFSIWLMITISPVMTLVVAVGIPLMLWICSFVVKKSQPVFDAQQEALADLSSTVNELYSGYNEILAYNCQKQAREQFEKVNLSMKEKGFKSQVLSGTIEPLTSLVTYLMIGCCAVYGCLQVMTGTMTLGSLQAFIRYIWLLNNPISQISQLTSAVQAAFAGMHRLFTFLSLPEEEQTGIKEPIAEVNSVAFENVAFSYNREQPLMHNLSFQAGKGQTVAIVGPTGAGKTTVANLLLRFYSPISGRISINGCDIQDLSCKDLRGLYGLVMQDPWLFEGTVRENLLYGSPDATDQKMIEAAQKAGVHEIIEQLSSGYQTILSEGADNISQGEKQLLTIVRTLIRDPGILILDEATSSMDTRTERRLQKAMDVLLKTRTCFVIAHRLSTIVNADLILVMDQGTIVEQG
ncbi:MAG: ABC transporter ATP-binding protein, partial [Erysipelotrichaceae bacterium]|nr:ABC transporter ATP-binding protein [Erysipelotrichaceae bacterium]